MIDYEIFGTPIPPCFIDLGEIRHMTVSLWYALSCQISRRLVHHVTPFRASILTPSMIWVKSGMRE